MNVTNLLATQASQTPDASAIATNMGALSFADLDRAVSRSAKSFQDQGLESGDWVGILLAAPVQNLVASLAVARLGAGQVPIYTSDKPAAVRQLCKSLNIDWVISDSTGASPWTRTLAPPPGGLAALKALRPIDFPIDSDGESLFTVMRTSGTSAGKPKLGYLTQAAGVERISVQNDFAPGDRFLQLLGGEYYSARQDYIRCISAGGCAGFDETVTVRNLARRAADLGINVLCGTLVHANRLLEIAPEATPLLPGLRNFKLSSSAIPEALRPQIRSRLSPNLHIYYSMTEVGRVSVLRPEMVGQSAGSVGPPGPGIEVEIIGDDGAVLTGGEIGRLKVKSAAMIARYLGDAEAFAGAISGGWFQTEDMVSINDAGELIHHGRADDVMIYDGINIYPAEIENVLLRHVDVIEAAAFPIPGGARGQMPGAAVVVRAGARAMDLQDHCHEMLGERAPVQILRLRELPKNAAGKVVTSELTELAQNAAAGGAGR